MEPEYLISMAHLARVRLSGAQITDIYELAAPIPKPAPRWLVKSLSDAIECVGGVEALRKFPDTEFLLEMDTRHRLCALKLLKDAPPSPQRAEARRKLLAAKPDRLVKLPADDSADDVLGELDL